jgi:uncharacterized protein YkwD/LysM repeat protein
MPRLVLFSVGGVLFLLFAVINSTTPSYAASEWTPRFAGSPYDLVNAVNALRASFGLAPYSISPILMATAQGQADFLAATGSMTHAGPGGIGLTARLLAAGYPLAGDLSLGGFRAENITGGDENMPPEEAVDRWTGDAPHLNTMVSPNLTEIGAGVAVSHGRVYYVIDAARPTTAGELPILPTPVGGGSPVPEMALPELIIPVSVSTPNADGNVFHDVKFGQTLWQIAITYNVKIDDIKRLNNLFDNNIYPGSSLLIKQGVAVPTASPSEGPTQVIASTGLPALKPEAESTPTALTPGITRSAATNRSVMNVMIGIIVLALLGGGIFTWIGSSKKNNS